METKELDYFKSKYRGWAKSINHMLTLATENVEPMKTLQEVQEEWEAAMNNLRTLLKSGRQSMVLLMGARGTDLRKYTYAKKGSVKDQEKDELISRLKQALKEAEES